MIRILSAGFAAMLASATPADADWLNTRWGMSLAEAKALYPGTTPDRFMPRLTFDAPVRFLDHDLSGHMLIYRHRLISVYLSLEGQGGCASLLEKLKQVYGPPSDVIDDLGKMSVVRKSWQWYLPADDIALDLFKSGHCDLRFIDPKITPKPDGLPL